MTLVLSVTEYGYEEAALGFSLSYNTTVERAKQIMPKYAWGSVPGENKFLRVISVWIDCKLPRFMWQEADQYKVATTTLSESTVHTLKKCPLSGDDFVKGTGLITINAVNTFIELRQRNMVDLQQLKANLPEGFLQRRIWHVNYATLQNIRAQRYTHPIKLWREFIDEVVGQLQHPEFVIAEVNA